MKSEPMTEEYSIVAEDLFTKRLALWEIVSIFSSVVITEWLLLSVGDNDKLMFCVPVALAFLLMVVSHVLRGENFRDIGIRWDNFGAAVVQVAIPTLILGGLIVAVGWFVSSLHFGEFLNRSRYLLLPFWALLQQYAVQGFINRRAQIAYGLGWKSVLIVAILFGLLHLPNLGFAALTFAMCVVWAVIYQRTPNLFALAVSHTVLAILLGLSLPSTWLSGLRVGFKAFG
jgi:membrane protease YdiL (CAAX protease family)